MRTLLSIFLLLAPLFAQAKESLAYLYIQGDKQTPFYVKLEETMQPRYGKNYCIISQLAPGPAHIEILFQQNAFPAQKFTVMIPDGGSRGFLLVKKDEGFSLYDLQQGFYLNAGNSEEDDRLPVSSAAAMPVAQTEVTAEPEFVQKSLVVEEKPEVKKPEKKIRRPKPQTTVPVTTPASRTPAFIPDIELSGKGAPGSNTGTAPAKNIPEITNSDCPSAISAADFRNIFSGMSSKGADEDRLGFAMDKMDVCYESWQARAMAQMLTGEASRFMLLKRIYPRITDQSSFPLLDDLFSTEVWKAEFLKLVRRQ